ncbi:MAG TPA: bifunctional hydroxymethylpyrimidine kinase/phosphomethylpyrimidine kinase [Thermodesulfobacteriota bacterium]|nr:bifunctional hydroxymethylpyrimidine kinase/phosphomethylpyrimidine kinase [Thermodesulfobacteriota bacterium]
MYPVLTIAGSDPSGGAGIQADLKTFAAFRVYGMAALTALTVQNTCGVRGFTALDPDFVVAQVEAVLDDIPPAAAKTGMLANAAIVRALARLFGRRPIPHLVVDPVMVATSGDLLLEPDAVEAVRSELLPLAAVITPNRPEAETLLGRPIASAADAADAARELARLGPRAVLLKGGHAGGGEAPQAVDLLYDGRALHELALPRLDTPHTHGTGCTLSAALAAGLARGWPLLEAARRAKRFVWDGLAHGFPVGRGRGPVNHLVPAVLE